MEYLKLLVDLAKAIAWPSAVFALGYMFRSDVRALFPRLTKAGPTGLEFDPARQLLAAASKELKVGTKSLTGEHEPFATPKSCGPKTLILISVTCPATVGRNSSGTRNFPLASESTSRLWLIE